MSYYHVFYVVLFCNEINSTTFIFDVLKSTHNVITDITTKQPQRPPPPPGSHDSNHNSNISSSSITCRTLVLIAPRYPLTLVELLLSGSSLLQSSTLNFSLHGPRKWCSTALDCHGISSMFHCPYSTSRMVWKFTDTVRCVTTTLLGWLSMGAVHTGYCCMYR